MQYFGFDRPSFGIKTFGFGDSFDPMTLFAGGKQGVWYDPSDKSTLFQDVAGTVPVTKDGDPVALMRDKSGNGNHATQTVSTSRPVYKTDGVLHWLYFDGVDDALGVSLTMLSTNMFRAISLSDIILSSFVKYALAGYGDSNKNCIRYEYASRSVGVIGGTLSGSGLQYFGFSPAFSRGVLAASFFADELKFYATGQTEVISRTPFTNSGTSDGLHIMGVKSLNSQYMLGGRVYGVIQSEALSTKDMLIASNYLTAKAGVTL